MTTGSTSNTPAEAFLHQEEGLSCPSGVSKETRQTQEGQEKWQQENVSSTKLEGLTAAL